MSMVPKTPVAGAKGHVAGVWLKLETRSHVSDFSVEVSLQVVRISSVPTQFGDLSCPG